MLPMVFMLLLTGCLRQSINRRMSESLGIDIPNQIKIEYEDTHGGFHGDGDTTAIAEFTGVLAEEIQAEITADSDWKSLPFSEDHDMMMYGGVKNGIQYAYDFAELLDMPRIENGFWYYEDRQIESGLSSEGQALFPRASYNFTMAVYDLDTDLLYYLEVDT